MISAGLGSVGNVIIDDLHLRIRNRRIPAARGSASSSTPLHRPGKGSGSSDPAIEAESAALMWNRAPTEWLDICCRKGNGRPFWAPELRPNK
jgi:hypothetical protein